MKIETFPRDLVVLTADRNTHAALKGLLSRPAALGIRPISFEIHTHPQRDPGCLRRADAFLRPFTNRFGFALVVFDHSGCGKEKKPPEDLEAELLSKLSHSGWPERAAVIVIAPELENWVFSPSPQVELAMGWSRRTPGLRVWLKEKGLMAPGRSKPLDPKTAMQAALRHVRMPRSSSIYEDLAGSVSFSECSDRAFLKLQTVLKQWFQT